MVQTVAVLFFLAFGVAALPEDAALTRVAVIPIFSDAAGNYDKNELRAAVEDVFVRSGRFVAVDVSSHQDYSGSPEDQNLRLRAMAADLGIDMFVLLDVSPPTTTVSGGVNDELSVARVTSVDVTGRFYTSNGGFMGSVRETVRSGNMGISDRGDNEQLALQGAVAVAERSLFEVFPVEFRFTVAGGPVYSMGMGTDNGIKKGMVFSVVALSRGIPRSAAEYNQLRSYGLLQVTDVDESSSKGRLISGHLVDGARVTAVENGAPALLALSFALFPIDVVPGDGLTGDEADSTRLMSQIEFEGSTCKWGYSFSGAIFSGVLPRMASIGVRGKVGARLPVSSPSLALRVGIGFEASYLVQNTRADSISSSANTAAFAGIGSLVLEWMFSDRFGVRLEGTGRLGTTADSWNVTDPMGYSREALPGELYFSEIKQPPVGVSAGLTYLLY